MAGAAGRPGPEERHDDRVDVEREGRHVTYRLTNPGIAPFLEAADDLISEHREQLASCRRIGPDWIRPLMKHPTWPEVEETPMITRPRSAELSFTGMTCEASERHIATALEPGAGAEHASADFRGGTAQFDGPDGVAEDDLRAGVTDAGYGHCARWVEEPAAPHPAGGPERPSARGTQPDVEYDVLAPAGIS